LLTIISARYESACRIKDSSRSTTDFLNIRFIGDRSINEKDFEKIHKDRVIEMKKWAGKVKRMLKEEGSGVRRGIRKRTKKRTINLAIVSC
jgi:hypothetical protein